MYKCFKCGSTKIVTSYDIFRQIGIEFNKDNNKIEKTSDRLIEERLEFQGYFCDKCGEEVPEINYNDLDSNQIVTEEEVEHYLEND